MCGICGIVSGGPGVEEDLRLSGMLEALTPRGPDEEGIFRGGNARLGVRRLRIIDLKTGRQPMSSADGRLTVVFNGEIYNFRELRRELEGRGHAFNTQSDTEAILRGFEEWGAGAFDRLDGMFAIAVWDASLKTLTLARDRIGEKPLYWSHESERFVFASELRAIRLGLTRDPRPDRAAAARYLFFGYSPSPDSLLEGVGKLRPGEILTFQEGNVTTRRFWTPPDIAERGASDSALLPALTEAVRSRLVSDVPLGAFLSGGIDSTIVVDRMASLAAAPATFSIGFADSSYDESEKAASVAQALGTRHTGRVFSEDSLIGLLSSLGKIIDEPLADASILPTYLLSGLARENVTVALSGDGGDELFGGYPTYPLHRWVGRHAHGRTLGRGLRLIAKSLPISDANLSFDFRLRKLAGGLGHEAAWRHALWMCCCDPEQIRELVPDLPPGELRDLLFEPVGDRLRGRAFPTAVDLAMHLDLTMYLAEGVLMKVDRASMARSLEVRAPFLARDAVGLAFSIPAARKVGFWSWQTKLPLRRMLRARFPARIVSQPKKGFGIPVSRWLRTAARDRVEATLKDVPFDRDAVARLWAEHQSRRRNNRMTLWALFIYGEWCKRL
jgi:asparagine synthase (glutamine-hydrolysing)